MELSDVFGALAWLSVLTVLFIIVWLFKEAFAPNPIPEPKYIFIDIPCSSSSINKETLVKSKVEAIPSSNPAPSVSSKTEPSKNEENILNPSNPLHPLLFTNPLFTNPTFQ